MKNREFHKLLKRNGSKSNSGFTLTELLVGLIMGTIVIGGLGFGLVHLLRNTQTQTAFSGARNNSSRALDFISDEVKRAVAIENTSVNANGFITTDRTVVFALDIPEVNGDSDPDGDTNLFGVDDDTTTTERIVYFLQDVDDMPNTPWQGPLVLHRWGPPLDANGDYTDGAWQAEALIDGIDDTVLTANACNINPLTAANPTGGEIVSPATPTGFYSCIQDDDRDGIVENGAVDTNGDGVVDTNDSNDDADGIGIAAQLFLTSGVDIGRTDTNGNSVLDTYTADTQVVARARVAPENNSDDLVSYVASLESFPNQYGRNINSNLNTPCWRVRSDFGAGRDPRFDPNIATPNPNALTNVYTWVHEQNRQPQPLNIDTSQPFTMVASAFAAQDPSSSDFSQCIARGNRFKQRLVSIDSNGDNANYSNVDTSGNDVSAGNEVQADGTEEIHTYEQKIWHTIEFPQKNDSASEIAQKRATFNGNDTENADVKGDGTVYVFRNDSVVPDTGGYDVNGDGVYNKAEGDQPSLREFLRDPDGDGNNNDAYVNANGTFKEGKLGKDQRLIAFEIGQTEQSTGGNTNPGFDLQDNLFVITSEAFSSYDSSDD